MSYDLKEPILVVTDLDGTLLDHTTYSWKAAQPSLDFLSSKNIPIIINTSKTFMEVRSLQNELAIDTAFIVENGSAIYVKETSPLAKYFDPYKSGYKRIIFGDTRETILKLLHDFRNQYDYNFTGYADWQVKDIVQKTGLTKDKAILSLDRQFSEPIIWKDTHKKFKLFKNKLENYNLRLIKGGRFFHVLGNTDKGKSISKLKNIIYKNKKITLICLGDSHNDLDMLNLADIPVIVRSPVHDYPKHLCKNPPLFTQEYGPHGWHQAITKIFKSFN